jgi:hypothetical protein
LPLSRLVIKHDEAHIQEMSAALKNTKPARNSAATDRTVVYRGIKIAPVAGKRSALAQAIHDGLKAKTERAIDTPVSA